MSSSKWNFKQISFFYIFQNPETETANFRLLAVSVSFVCHGEKEKKSNQTFSVLSILLALLQHHITLCKRLNYRNRLSLNNSPDRAWCNSFKLIDTNYWMFRWQLVLWDFSARRKWRRKWISRGKTRENHAMNPKRSVSDQLEATPHAVWQNWLNANKPIH